MLAATHALPGAAQQPLIDRGVRAGGLWCFPLATDPQQYVYLPTGARLATGESGDPEFSFLRYVINRESSAGEASITTAEGGAVLHFLVLYETPQESIAAAQQELRRRLEDDEIVLRGPIVFDGGTYNLVSSIVGDDGLGGRHLLASGRAPVLEGNRLALSFGLAPERSKLLMESLEMSTPDLSLVFDMSFSGLTEAYDATLTVDWSEVKQSQRMAAGGSVYFVSADVEVALEELRRDNAIRLETSGEHAASEALLAQVYDKLLDLLFRPVEPESVPVEHRGGLMDALNALLDTRSGALSSRNTTGFGAYVGYQVKDLRSEGVSVMDFNSRAQVERHDFITFNVGELLGSRCSDERFCRTVNIGDAAFQQREVRVALDGELAPEFDSYINSVTVTLRKRHQDGEETVRELVLDRDAVAAAADLRMVYGWSGDLDRTAWLDYEYRTRWAFQGGGSYDTDWRRTDSPMIDLFAPYERRSVELVGGAADLSDRGVRAVVVRVEYPFFDERRSEQAVLRPGRDEDERRLEITLPLGEYAYDYGITWMLMDGARLEASGVDDSGVIFVDEIPEQ
jgi:hypothetical protein